MAELEPDGKGHPEPQEHLPWMQPQERNPVGLGMDPHMESMVIHLHCWSCMHEPGTGTSCSQPKSHETQVQREQGDQGRGGREITRALGRDVIALIPSVGGHERAWCGAAVPGCSY